MVEKDDWRLLNDVEYLKNKCMNPTDGEDITKHAHYLKKCIFCWEKVQDTPHQWWFVPEDMSCCICEECYNDFKKMFGWKKLDGWDIDWTVRCPRCGTEEDFGDEYMLTLNDMKQIVNQLPSEKTMVPDYDLSEDVSCIAYRMDKFDCGGSYIISRHIDIEFIFGDYVELHERDELFQYICSLCNLQVSTSGEEIILYQK